LIRWLLSTDTSVTTPAGGSTTSRSPTSRCRPPAPATRRRTRAPSGKAAPANGATNQPTDGLTLSWNSSTSATGYEVCIDTVSNGLCDTSWSAVGAAPEHGDQRAG